MEPAARPAPATRRQPDAPRLVAAGVTVVAGLANLVLGGAHLAGVVARALRGEGFNGAAEFTYDFHFYSLVMLGLLLVVPGGLAAGGAVALARGRGGWRLAWWSSLVLVVVNAPLIGRNPFALLLTATAGAALVALLLLGRRFR